MMNQSKEASFDKGTGTRAKDHAVTGTILATAAIAWFGWGHVGERLTSLLALGMVVGVVVVARGVILTRSVPGPTTMATDAAARRTYWSAMGAQVVAILAGLVLLGTTENPSYVPAWVLSAVGIHFLPLAKAVGVPILGAAGWACIAVAALATGMGIAGWAPASSVAGGGGGLVLVLAALFAFRVARRG